MIVFLFYRVQQDVMESLCLQNPLVLKSSFNRPNIYYEGGSCKFNLMTSNLFHVPRLNYSDVENLDYFLIATTLRFFLMCFLMFYLNYMHDDVTGFLLIVVWCYMTVHISMFLHPAPNFLAVRFSWNFNFSREVKHLFKKKRRRKVQKMKPGN